MIVVAPDSTFSKKPGLTRWYSGIKHLPLIPSSSCHQLNHTPQASPILCSPPQSFLRLRLSFLPFFILSSSHFNPLCLLSKAICYICFTIVTACCGHSYQIEQRRDKRHHQPICLPHQPPRSPMLELSIREQQAPASSSSAQRVKLLPSIRLSLSKSTLNRGKLWKPESHPPLLNVLVACGEETGFAPTVQIGQK